MYSLSGPGSVLTLISSVGVARAEAVLEHREQQVNHQRHYKGAVIASVRTAKGQLCILGPASHRTSVMEG